MSAAADRSAQQAQLWLELPPISPLATSRLLVFLHGAGSSPEAFAPIAVAWQLKFPGARVIIMQGLQRAADRSGSDWFDATGPMASRREQITAAVRELTVRIATLQSQFQIDAQHTMLIGFSQGATMVLEAARQSPAPASIVVAYAARLARPILPDEQVDATVHLLHGEFDTWVPLPFAEQAHRGLRAIGADVTLDVIESASHTIDADMLIVSTTRAMQTVFRGRRRRERAIALAPALPPSSTLH